MKLTSSVFLIPAVSIFLSCADNKAATAEQQTAGKPAVDNKEAQTTASAVPGNDLVGSWKLRQEVYDDNSNRIPDEEELKKGYSNNYHLQLNADGTCRIQQVFKGRYEKKIEEGREMLYVYRKKIEGEEDQDPQPDKYQITSLKKDELVLQIIAGDYPASFWFFKRIN